MNTFPRQARLIKSCDFRFVFQNAHKHASRYFTVLVRKNSHGYARIGLVISRKCSNRAVVRNRIKRVVRERFRKEKDHLGGKDIVVIGRPTTAKALNKQLTAEIDKHWADIKSCEYCSSC